MAERKKAKRNRNKEKPQTGSATAAMQDLYRKMQLEGSLPADEHEKKEAGSSPTPRYDEDLAVSTRKQLLEDYRRELLVLYGEKTRKSPRPSLYEYEDLTPEEESFEEEASAEEIDEITKEPFKEIGEEPTVEIVEGSVEETVEEPTVEIVEGSVEETAEELIMEIVEGSVEETIEAPTVEIVEGSVEETVEELTMEIVEGSVEETAEEPTVEIVEGLVEETLDAPSKESDGKCLETKKVRFFRAVNPFRNQKIDKERELVRTEPSKEKDPYSVYDYDMAQEFGYIPQSRERTVSQVNEFEGARNRRVVVYSKPDASAVKKNERKHARYGKTMLRKSMRVFSQRESRRARAEGRTEHRSTMYEPERISERENARIRENPKKMRDIALRRVILTGIVAVVLCFWEYLPLLPGGSFLPLGLIANTQYPLLYIGVAVILLLVDLALLGRAFYPAFIELILFRCTPRSLTAFSVAMALLNDLFSSYILMLGADAEYGMFHFPAAIAVLLYAVGAYATVSRKIDVYAVCGVSRTKYLLTADELCDHIQNRDGAKKREEDQRIRRFTAANDVCGIEKRLDSEDRYDGFPGFRRLFFLLVLFGMAAMVISALLSSNEPSFPIRLSGAVNAFFWTVFLCLPLSATELRRLPLLRVSEQMKKKNTALIGDAAALEYASVGRVAVRSEMFFRKHPFCLGECVGDDPEQISYYLSSILKELGEPFSCAVSGGCSENVRLLEVSECTVRALVDGVAVALHLGDNERKGYRLSDAGASLRESAYRIPLYISVRGDTVGACSLYVQNDSEYPALVRALYDHGLKIRACHYTFLPFLTEKNLQIPVPSKNRMRFPEVRNLASDTVAARLQSSAIRDGVADSGIAALNKPRDIWLPLVYAQKITAYNRFSAVLAWLSVLSGALLSILTVLGILPIASYPILVSLLPIAFGGITYLFSNYYLS